MVAEQNVGDELELETPPDGRETVEESLRSLVVDEQVALVAPVGANVVEALGEGARTTRHPASLGACLDSTRPTERNVTHLAHFGLDTIGCPTPSSRSGATRLELHALACVR